MTQELTLDTAQISPGAIHEVANFSAHLSKERETIKERVERINQSLTQIDYNPGRFITLELQTTTDPEVRDFQTELRACLDGALGGGSGGDTGGGARQPVFRGQVFARQAHQ